MESKNLKKKKELELNIHLIKSKMLRENKEKKKYLYGCLYQTKIFSDLFISSFLMKKDFSIFKYHQAFNLLVYKIFLISTNCFFQLSFFIR